MAVTQNNTQTARPHIYHAQTDPGVVTSLGLSLAENIPLPTVVEDAKGFICERFFPDSALQ